MNLQSIQTVPLSKVNAALISDGEIIQTEL
jgi:hypothetical protein